MLNAAIASPRVPHQQGVPTQLERQITRLRELVAATAGDTSALRAQLARKLGELSDLENRRANTQSAVRFAQVALNLTTVRPPDKPAEHNWFVRGLDTGWDRLVRLAERVVSVLVVILPLAVVLGFILLPLVRHRRRAQSAI